MLPKLDELRGAENKYRRFIGNTHELEVLNSFSKLWDQDLQKISEAELDMAEEFKPKELFGEDTVKGLLSTFRNILLECHYEELQTIIFDFKK